MPELIPNRFSAYTLTQVEELTGSMLTSNNKAVIQNLIAERATFKLDLEPDDPEFVKQSAYYAGQIEILEYLLANSDAHDSEYVKAPTSSNLFGEEEINLTVNDYLADDPLSQ